MNFFEIPKRLALVLALQIAGCVYLALWMGMLVKIRQAGDPSMYLPLSGSTLWMKSHCWMLMALPVAWYWLHVRRWMKAGADWVFLANVVASGIAVLFVLALLALAAFITILRTRGF